MYKIINHTADIGIKVEGPLLADLFINAADATFDLMFSSKRAFISSIEVPVVIEAPGLDQLMVRWLQELIFIFESRRLVLSRFWIDSIDLRHLAGVAKGQKFDPTRHTQKLSIKAVTYHQISVKKCKDGLWHAQVIFDI